MSDDLLVRLGEAVDTAFESEQVPFLQRLVDQPSHTLARADVEAAALIIEERAADLGLRCTRIPDPGGCYADHRIYQSPATGDGEQVPVLAGHCDTVYPRSQNFLKFMRDAPDSESGGDVIRGPGVLDMKSGLSVILFGLQAIKRADPERFDQLKIRFICNSDEEVGSPSSKALYDELATRTSWALVFEGGRDGDRIITCRKGTGMFKIRAIGCEAHAGNFHAAGVNAIHALALVIPQVEALTDYAEGTTINVGLIEGGTAKNTVPGEASCVIDLRLSTLQAAARVDRRLHEIVADPFSKIKGVPDRLHQARFALEGCIRRPPMEATEANRELQRAYETAAAAEGLGTGEAPLQGGGSDANLFAVHGVPVIDGLGPYGKDLHSINEWSSLDSLRKRTRALARFLAQAQ